jgi:hypothetical protein
MPLKSALEAFNLASDKSQSVKVSLVADSR